MTEEVVEEDQKQEEDEVEEKEEGEEEEEEESEETVSKNWCCRLSSPLSFVAIAFALPIERYSCRLLRKALDVFPVPCSLGGPIMRCSGRDFTHAAAFQKNKLSAYRQAHASDPRSAAGCTFGELTRRSGTVSHD